MLALANCTCVLIAYTYWIDVCQRDGNLLTAGGSDKNIKIFDKRESKIVKIFQVHQSNVL